MSALPTVPALVVGKVHHVRHRPLHHAFTHRHYQWLVDLDETWNLDDDVRAVVALVGFGLLLAAIVVLWHAAPRSRGRRPLLPQDAPQPLVDGCTA